MTFTDEDLKRLKIDSEAWVSPYWDHKKIQALLHRLECAEAYACECRELGADDTELYEAWRKSAGK